MAQKGVGYSFQYHKGEIRNTMSSLVESSTLSHSLRPLHMGVTNKGA